MLSYDLCDRAQVRRLEGPPEEPVGVGVVQSSGGETEDGVVQRERMSSERWTRGASTP